VVVYSEQLRRCDYPMLFPWFFEQRDIARLQIKQRLTVQDSYDSALSNICKRMAAATVIVDIFAVGGV
jgi:hypothetical protein